VISARHRGYGNFTFRAEGTTNFRATFQQENPLIEDLKTAQQK
jgi:hypothetical protein